MTRNTRSLSGAFGSLFGAIAATMDGVSQTVTTSMTTIDVLDHNVQRWVAESKHQKDIALKVLEETAQDEINLAVAEKTFQIQEKLSRNPELAQLFLSIQKKRSEVSEA